MEKFKWKSLNKSKTVWSYGGEDCGALVELKEDIWCGLVYINSLVSSVGGIHKTATAAKFAALMYLQICYENILIKEEQDKVNGKG